MKLSPEAVSLEEQACHLALSVSGFVWILQKASECMCEIYCEWTLQKLWTLQKVWTSHKMWAYVWTLESVYVWTLQWMYVWTLQKVWAYVWTFHKVWAQDQGAADCVGLGTAFEEVRPVSTHQMSCFVFALQEARELRIREHWITLA